MEIVKPWPCGLTAEEIVNEFSRAVNTALPAWQERLAGEPGSLGRVEHEALALVRPFAGYLVLAALRAREVQTALAGKAEALRLAAPERPRKVYRRARVLRLLCGLVVRVVCEYCAPRREPRGRGWARGAGRRGKEGVGLYPEWCALGIREGISPALQDEAGRLAVLLSSLEAAREELERRGVRLDEKTLRRIALELGGGALAWRRGEVERFRRGEVAAGQELEGRRVVVAIDGGRARLRVERKGKRTRKRRHGFETPWREPKLAVIYTLAEGGRVDRESGVQVAGTLQGPDHLMELVALELHRLGAARARSVEFVGDGAEWIWDRVGRVVAQAGLEQRRVYQAVDLSHVVAQLAAALEAQGKLTAETRKRERSKLRRKLKEGKVEEVIAYLEARAGGRGARVVRGVIEYLRKRRGLLRYDELLRRRLPIGSGAVESAIRRVLNLRLKSPGTFWKEESLEAFLVLRAAALTGRWDELLRGVREFSSRTRRLEWRWEPTPYSAKAPASDQLRAAPGDKPCAA